MKKHWIFTTILAITLCAVCLTLLPAEAKAASASNLSYTLNSDGKNYTVSDCKESASGKLTIPETYKDKPVTGIGDRAFSGCSSLTEIVIPNGVTTIGNFAFDGCTGLTSISLPDGLVGIGTHAFQICRNLAEIDIPDSVRSIGKQAFSHCSSLKAVVIPEGVTALEELILRGCTSLKSVKLPDSLKEIEDGVFTNCTALQSVTIPRNVDTVYGDVFANCTSLKEVKFTGDCPKLYVHPFANVTTTVYYPAGNKTWTQDKMDDVGGDVTWISYTKASIATQPKTAKVKSGATAKFAVKATGTGLKYQWQSSSNGKTWKNCSSSSATKATFSFASKTSHNGNYYRCKVTDGAGNVVYTSSVRLYVLGVTTQPKVQTVKAGAAVKFTVKATGDGLKYQWQSSSDGKTWKNCSSSNSKKASFSFTSKTSHNGNYYRCMITDAAGNVVYTDTVRLYVLGVTTQPKTQKVEAGTAVKLTTKATGDGLKYQWQSSSDGKTWKNCSSTSAKKATFSFTSKTSHDGNYYRCKVTDSAGNVVYTSTVRLYVLGIEEQPVKKTVTKGKTAKFEVEATGHSLKYQWQVSTDGGKTFKNCTSSKATSATFTFTSKTSHNGNYYRCRVKDSGGNTVYTAKVKLTVK